MSFFTITNNQDIKNAIADELLLAGYTKSEEKYYINKMLLYKKRKINNDNYFSDGGSFIATTGTFVFKGKLNREALEMCLEFYNNAIKNESIENVIGRIRQYSLGNYSVIIGNETQQYVFVDENECYAAYYYSDSEKYVIASSYYHIAKYVNAEVNLNSFFDLIIRGCPSGKHTPIKGVYRIKADEILCVSGDCIKEIKCNPNSKEYNFKDFKEAAECLYDEVKKVLEESKCVYREGSTLLFVTGGLDSRLELAYRALVDNNVYLGYWMGNNVITNGTIEDSVISKKLSEMFEYTYMQFNVSQSYAQSFGEQLRVDWNRYGELANIYAHNLKWIEMFNVLPSDIASIGFGYFGEIFQNLSVLDATYHPNYSIADFIKNVYCRNGIDKCVIKHSEIYEHIESELKQLGYKADWTNMTKLDCANLFNRTRYHADTASYNFINKFYYGFSIFSQKRITDIVESIPYEWKTDGRLELYLTKLANEKCVEIPYFTHHHYVNYDKNKNQITEFKKDQFVNFFAKNLKNTFLYKPLRNVMHNRKQRKKGIQGTNDKLLKQINSILGKTKFYKKYEDKLVLPQNDVGFTLESYAGMVFYVKLLECLAIGENDAK